MKKLIVLVCIICIICSGNECRKEHKVVVDWLRQQHTTRAQREIVHRWRQNTVQMPSERAEYLLVEAELMSLV